MAPRIFFIAAFLLASFSSLYAADNSAAAPNSDPTYQQLRNLTLSGEALSVSNFALKRDAGTFHLHSGTVCFVTPVQGKVTGAVFVGDGHFVLDPPSESERNSLKLLTKENEFSESFSHAVLRFTDSTYDDIKKGGRPASGACDANLLRDSQNTTRQKLKDNLEARILQDLLSAEPGGLFVAFIHGKRYSDKELFTIDPHSSSDQVELTTYDESKLGVWMGYSLLRRDKSISRNRIHIEHQQLDTTVEKSGNLIGKASSEFVSLIDGLRVVPFDLFHTLRVDNVAGDGGVSLPFIQEDKHEDADFAVILPKPLAAGEKYTVTIAYGGREAVTNEGGGNYYPVARSSWFPNNPSGG
ncbi:MAG: hypothetical protein ACLP56_06220, partial [Candidatus Sulfotelmatobacter sp.]